MALQRTLLLALLSLSSLLSVAQAEPVLLDDFNRAVSPSMGSDWTEHTGDFSISGQQALSGADDSLMTFVGATADSISIDVLHNGVAAPQYTALILAYNNASNNIFVKVQDNGGAADYDRLSFRRGPTSELSSVSLATPFTSARMTATLVGTTVTVGFDTDFNGTADQTYSEDDYNLVGLGTAIGLGGYGNATMDNFRAAVIPEPVSLAFLGSAFGGVVAVGVQRRRRQSR